MLSVDSHGIRLNNVYDMDIFPSFFNSK